MSGARTFEVWPLDDRTSPVLVDVRSEYPSPEWHLICDAAIAVARAWTCDATRPHVVCVRERSGCVTHYVAPLGPPGAGTYAKYLGTTAPPEGYMAKPLEVTS